MSAHSSRLQHAHKDLREKWDIARRSWTDQVARDFEKNHLDPLQHLVNSDAHGDGQAVGGAGKIRRQCEENS